MRGEKERGDSPYGKLISPDALHVIVIALFHFFDKYVDGSHTSPVLLLAAVVWSITESIPRVYSLVGCKIPGPDGVRSKQYVYS
jgi:hypothetical protein